MLSLAFVIAAQIVPHGAEAEQQKEEVFVDDSAAPKEQTAALAIFTGTWRCDGKANTELAEEVPTKLTITFTTPLKRWVTVKIEEQSSKQNPHAMTSQEVWGYSSVLGGLVRNGADSQGGFYAGKSNGWAGDRFWWDTETTKNGKKMKLKDSFTKRSDKELVFERSVDPTGTGDAFRIFYEGTCKR